MEKIAVIYGPKGGNTQRVAEMVAHEFGQDKVVLIPVNEISEEDLLPYQCIIFGGPTVGTHTWTDKMEHDDWDVFLTKLYKMDLKGKRCAIFGLGDQVSYAFHFIDDVGVIAGHLEEAGATLVGKVSGEGYKFEDSKAFVDGKFLGLPIDEDYEPEKTAGRVHSWVEQLRNEFKIS